MTPPLPFATFVTGRLLALSVAALLALFALPANACTRTTSTTTHMGAYSPAAAASGTIPARQTPAGLACAPSTLSLLDRNYIRATFVSSTNSRKVKLEGGSATIAYTASADAAGTLPFTGTTPVDYMRNNLLNILGLLGDSEQSLPISLRFAAGGTPAPGLYKDRITIRWEWYICPAALTQYLCLGIPDTDTATVTIDVSLRITRDLVIVTSTSTEWDPVSGSNKPKDLPGSRQTAVVTVTNPDASALDQNTVVVVLPVATNQAVTLGADGSGTSQQIVLTEGSPASSLVLSYTGAASTSDDVDFSSDGGSSWTFLPTEGDDTSLRRVTTVRLRPRGTMAPNSSFSIGVPVKVR